MIEGKTCTAAEALALAKKYLAERKIDAGLIVCRHILRAHPEHPETLNCIGMLFYERREFERAETYFRQAIRIKPDAGFFYNNLGYMLMGKGELKEAEKIFEHSLALDPCCVQALQNLAMIRRYTSPDHPDAQRILALLARDNVVEQDRQHLYFALGKIYDDCGRWDDAFSAYQNANRIRNATIAFDIDACFRRPRKLAGAFTREFFAQNTNRGSENASPLFIVGMPRSGTTLLNNILSKHPQVASAGELPTMSTVAAEMVAQGGVITPELLAASIRRYETRLTQDVPEAGKRYIIDKFPLNFLHLGFIYLLFPKARIIHCQRNAMDTCLSNYFQCFSNDYDYAFDLRNVGYYYRAYRELMDHWRQALPMPMLEVQYESLVSDTEATAGSVLDYLGLPWDDACLSPHTLSSFIGTSSVYQARQPVYRTSMERWKHYEKHLAPLIEILQYGNSQTLS